MWLFLSCIAVGDPLGGSWTFEGEDVVGVSEAPTGCDDTRRIGLWGKTWGTDGHVRATVVEEEPGIVWLHFAVQTGLGEATAAMRVEGNGAVVPMGVRPGEWAVHLERQPGSEGAQILTTAEARATESIAAEKAMWSRGAFLIRDGEQTIGDVQFRGSDPPLIALYSHFWLTPGIVPADLHEDGADLALRFAVEPAFVLEEGLIRISVPFREVVLPLGPIPSKQEVRFALVPGHVSEAEREAFVAAAIDESTRLEASYASHWGRELSRKAEKPGGGCHTFAQMDPNFWGQLLYGYDVHIAKNANGCGVDLEPTVKQHGRRFRGRLEGR